MDRIAIIRAESQRLGAVLAEADPEARCPTCPDWNAADLLWHLTEVHSFWSGVLKLNAQTKDDLAAVEEAKPERPELLADMVPIRASATEELLDQLDRLDDAEPRWTWWDTEQTVGFTRRMQTYEATMHRIDAELTVGARVTPITAEVAAGAVDHCVDVMWAWTPDWAHVESLAIVEFVATDTGQRWLVDIGHWIGTGPESGTEFDEPRAVRGNGTPTAQVTGTVEGLARWAWGRQGTVGITGEPAALAALDALITAGIE